MISNPQTFLKNWVKRKMKTMEAVIHSCEFINAIQNDQLYMCKRWDRSVDAGISVLYERLCI
jgi:hypothetical protein